MSQAMQKTGIILLNLTDIIWLETNKIWFDSRKLIIKAGFYCPAGAPLPPSFDLPTLVKAAHEKCMKEKKTFSLNRSE